jgi:hypothetical protein
MSSNQIGEQNDRRRDIEQADRYQRATGDGKRVR